MVSWAPDGARIASCSIDNEVIVWVLTGGPPRMLKRLQGPSGLVKGVAFDPIGKYLASQVRLLLCYFSLAPPLSSALSSNPFSISLSDSLCVLMLAIG